MAIDIKKVELEQLPGSPLALVVAQVRFLPVPLIDDATAMERFRAAVAAEWNLVDRQAVQQLVIQLGAGAPVQQNASAAGIVWQFASPDGRWKLALSQTSLTVESDAYSNFGDFISQLEHALTRAREFFPVATKSRFGLRYVNEIADPRLAASSGLLHFFTPEFLPVGGELGDSVAASYSEVRFDEKDGSLVIRHGLVQADKYLLDFDYYNEVAEDFVPDDIIKTATAYHNVIDSVFARAVTPAFMDEMKEGRSQ